MTEFCILCANGNDLPEGEHCRGCGREGLAFGLRAAVIKARGRQEPPTTPVAFDAADEIEGMPTEELVGVLQRCRTVLGNMALENEVGLSSIFNRWPISHEPLRADAKNLLPVIDAAISAAQGTKP